MDDVRANGGGSNGSGSPDDSVDKSPDADGQRLEHTHTHQVWKFTLRPGDDDDPQDWWFASTAIPLLAATLGPLANILSIAALVTYWRENRTNDGAGPDDEAIPYRDPHWCVSLNAASLACGFAGNIFLLFNFTQRIRYIVALPMTIILWYFATGILIAITSAMNQYVPPHAPQQTYSQGFWYAIIAAVLYLVNSMILMINMLGYFLGHYPQHFDLNDHQRTLILQTMMFFLWLAGGAAVFAGTCGWSYVDSLYFCDVTILTVGFGDFVPPNDLSRGLVFPFSVGGIIMLGLMVSSINRFSAEISHDKVLKKHVEKERLRTLSHSIGRPVSDLPEKIFTEGQQPQISGPIDMASPRSVSFKTETGDDPTSPSIDHLLDEHGELPRKRHKVARRVVGHKLARKIPPRPERALRLQEEKDRFDAMRRIQDNTHKWKRWWNLLLSITAFGVLWCVGAVVFWIAEQREQHLNYFEALYFCYVSLLTIGYGDLSPRSNAGKPFFVVWSLLAIPLMTILIGDLSDTVVASFKRGTAQVADWTVLPQAGRWRNFLTRIGMAGWVQSRAEKHAAQKRVVEGFTVAEEERGPPTLEQLAEGEPDEDDLAQRLAVAIRRTSDDLSLQPPKKYSYEEWAEFTRLIRFSSESEGQVESEEETSGLIDWDWIGKDSPMLAEQTEAEWILDRLCESLQRYLMKHIPQHKRKKKQRRDRGERRMDKVHEEDEADILATSETFDHAAKEDKAGDGEATKDNNAGDAGAARKGPSGQQ